MNRTIIVSSLLLIVVSACSLFAEQEATTANAQRVIHADVVALDQTLVFNRFGSHDPYGMIYALRRDVVSNQGSGELNAGQVRLRSDKRPRPLVLRANEGDILEVTFTNLLSPNRPGLAAADNGTEVEGQAIPQADIDRLDANNPCAATNPGSQDAPKTRCASIALSGITPIGDSRDGRIIGLHGIAPGQTITYRWRVEHKGSYLFSSLSAPSGGQGDGGSLVHGLFGSLNVEAKDSRWYRSAVSEQDFKLAQAQAQAPAALDYEAKDAQGNPVLNLLKPTDHNRFELMHSPLDAIIVETGGKAFREFSVIFHDELKTVYRQEFDILSPAQADKAMTPYSKQLAGVRDGFAINYGASGMGTILLANRLGIGPAKACVDCQYEEFFLQSWANGDPALLASYNDDPSNVHHSYLNDPVQFRNSHAGPKETHVFHLHAHQWESSNSGHANYLDSQTIGPQQSFAYAISHQGSGNLNQTPGDSIFHCHLYPHFAQGMWALWRVHDVFEDGSRRLPDGGGLPGSPDEGLTGKGTDPLTGQTQGGSPIPAIVPLPQIAMPPMPTYGTDGFAGFPFYIPGHHGHRAPQPPLDMVEDGGLGRHIVTGGSRRFNGGNTALEQVKSADMTLHIDSAQIQLLPAAGTQLEQNAMRFHEIARHSSKTPEGSATPFMANGKPRQPGAPFADPCGKIKNGTDVDDYPTRRYRASAIDLDIQANEHSWHDPQSRINVLDDEVPAFEHKRAVKDAEPFFFRAESGECVEFLHTNRTHDVLTRDSFQVATPTDIIGQHIHLVKFDVTSSDGSGNGFNYEDGTMARESIAMLAKASRAAGGSVVDGNGQPVSQPLAVKTDKHGNPIFQTTIQRWWVDPYFHEQGFDAGLGTVFTHDHFAPSSIQHHGFYNAMLVEPKGSKWLSASGRDLKQDDKACPALSIAGLADTYRSEDCKDSHAVGSRAQIVDAPDRDDSREFALAIADYAMLYDGKRKQVHVPHLMEAHSADYQAIARLEGYPVDPPQRPEAISTDHHNPYLINYKHEPIPLRIAERDSNGDFSKLLPSTCASHVDSDGKLCNPADPAYVFSSLAPHGDPFLSPLRAYEGDKVQIRLIQGAQEVQHSFSIHGLNWRREGHNPDAPLVNAQEIGISEHFELQAMDIPNTAQAHVDHLFQVDSSDGLWNGAWGMLRVFNGKEIKRVEKGSSKQVKNTDPGSCIDANGNRDSSKTCLAIADKRRTCSLSDDRFDRCQLQALPERKSGKDLAKNPATGGPGGGCPANLFNEPGGLVEFNVEAWQLKDLFNTADVKMPYDRQSGVYDPDALVFIQQKDREQLQQAIADPAILAQYRQGQKAVEPLVLRAETGKCLAINLSNNLPANQPLGDADGDALMPKITSLNVDKGQSNYATVPPSNRVSLHPQLVSFEVDTGDGVMVGLNQHDDAQADNQYARPQMTVTYHWYAGPASRPSDPGKTFPNGTVTALTSADVIGQATHGLIGALVIEPPGASWVEDSDSHLSARVSHDSKSYREFVVLYQDGLNLHQNGQVIPDCAICDDSYDFGEHAINYRSPAFWQRLGLTTHPQNINGEAPKGFDLNQIAFPADFFDPAYRPLPFNDFVAKAGEEMRFHVLHPTGRSRQRSFQLYGHSFTPWIGGYGSPWTMLMTPGKAETLRYEHAQPGNWLFRDGPAHIFANGSWGRLVVQ